MQLETLSTDALASHMRAAHRCAMRARTGDVACYFASIASDCLSILQARKSLRATVADMFAPFADTGAAEAIATMARAFIAGPTCQATHQGGTEGPEGGSKVRRRPRKPTPGAPQLASVARLR